MITVTVTLTCSGVWNETPLGTHEFGSFGLYEGECRTGRSGNATIEAATRVDVWEAAKKAGWVVPDELVDTALVQCPDCHRLSPIPPAVTA